MQERAVACSIAVLLGLSLVSLVSGGAAGNPFSSSLEYTVVPDAYNDTIHVATPDEMSFPRIEVDDRLGSPFYGTIYVLGVAAVANETRYVCWDSVVLSISTDGGHTFQRPYQTGTCLPAAETGGGRFIADLAVGTDGSLYLASGWYTILKSRDRGLTWETLNMSRPAFGVFSLAVDPITGVLYAAGIELGSRVGPPPMTFLASSVDGGRSWSIPIALAASSDSWSRPRVAAYDGTAVVALTSYANVSNVFYQATSAITLSDGVRIWNNLSVDEMGDSCVTGCLSLYPPAIAVSPDGTFVVSWTESNYSSQTGTGLSHNRMLTTLSRDRGRTFSAPVLAGESSQQPGMIFNLPTVIQNGPRIYVAWGNYSGYQPGTAEVFVAVSSGGASDFEEASFQTYLQYAGGDAVLPLDLAGAADGPVYLLWEAYKDGSGTGTWDENASGVFVRAVAGDASGNIVDESRSLQTVEIQLRDAVTGTVRARARWSGSSLVLDRLPPGAYSVEVLVDGSPSDVGEMPVLTWSRTTFTIRVVAGPPLEWIAAIGGLVVLLVAVALTGLQYMRLSKEAVLQRKVRLLLYEYVRDHPGSSFSALKNALGLQNGVAAYHLGVLEKQGLTHSVRRQYRRWYYPNGDVSLWRDLPLSALQTSIVEAVRVSPGVGIRELSRAIGRRSSSVAYNVKALGREGLLRTERAGRKLRCYPADGSGFV